MVFFQKKVMAMKIVGTYDELTLLKHVCAKRSNCDCCVMHVFCVMEGIDKKNILDLFSIEKFETIFIGGDNHGKER